MRTILIALALTALCMAPSAVAIDIKTFREAVAAGETSLNFRYRYELVDQEGVSEEAGASTLRSRLTWKSGAIGNWSAGVEADYVALLGSERYNSTENGNTEYPVVADPEGFDLNQAFLKYKSEKVSVTTGRQRILQADQRFVGGVAWRQNEQTYDAVRAEFAANKKLSFDYSYVWNVNRIFGPNDGAQPADWRSDSHFLSAKLALGESQSLEGFAYLLDFDNANGIPNSTSTYGLSYRGSIGPISITGTYATQSDYGDSPLDYDADFYSVSAKTNLGKVTVSAGYEVLGSDDGDVAFRTPLATLHKWQGWADKFLGTPAAGIEDAYVGVAGSIGAVKLAATYHEFKAEEGSLDYGDEFDLVANYQITKGASVQFKLAEYRADQFATDTMKIWFSVIIAL